MLAAEENAVVLSATAAVAKGGLHLAVTAVVEVEVGDVTGPATGSDSAAAAAIIVACNEGLFLSVGTVDLLVGDTRSVATEDSGGAAVGVVGTA
jgi:hypothetical protein